MYVLVNRHVRLKLILYFKKRDNYNHYQNRNEKYDTKKHVVDPTLYITQHSKL